MPHMGGQGARARRQGQVSTIFLAWGERYPEESWEAPLVMNLGEYDWLARDLQGLI